MKNIPARIWKSAGTAFCFGLVVLVVSALLPTSERFPYKELLRDLGIAFIVAGVISIIYEWSTRTAEKRVEMKSIIDESLSTFIPQAVWNEVKTEVLLRKVLRSNLTIDAELFRNGDVNGTKITGLPEHQAILKIKSSYDLYGVSSGNYSVDIIHYLDQHMRNDELDLPRFVSVKIKEAEKKQIEYNGEALKALIKDGCLRLTNSQGIRVPNMNENEPANISIERYELVNTPGLYTIIMPEMVVPFSKGSVENNLGKLPTITVTILTRDETKDKVDVSVETWFNSQNHQFEKQALDNRWVFKEVMLPGQGLSIIFSRKRITGRNT